MGRLIESGAHADVFITRQAVEDVVAQMQIGPVPSFIEHNPTLSVGRVIGGRLIELDDGKVAAESIIEIFDDTSPASIHSASQLDQAARRGDRIDARKAAMEIVFDPRSYNVADVNAVANRSG